MASMTNYQGQILQPLISLIRVNMEKRDMATVVVLSKHCYQPKRPKVMIKYDNTYFTSVEYSKNCSNNLLVCQPFSIQRLSDIRTSQMEKLYEF